MAMRNAQQQETIWITGASSGIGKQLCKALALKGHTVIASARNARMLTALAAQYSTIIPVSFDVTATDSIPSVQAEISRQVSGIDRVFLNAAICEYLEFPEPDWESVSRVMATNYQGSINCLNIALPLLHQRTIARGHIIGIVSQVTAAPFPRAEAYGASKAALKYFLESLRIDLQSAGIDISIINPGFVDTPMVRNNHFPMPFLMKTDTAVKKIIGCMADRPYERVFPRRLQSLLLLARMFPHLWSRMVAPDRNMPPVKK